MSSTAYDERTPSSVQTRRAQIRTSDREDPANRRSLSGRVRNFFRKNSSSPARSTVRSEGRSPPRTQDRSLSPSPIRTATEAPHLRAPTIHWPFGKKKTNATGTLSEKSKRKDNRRPERKLPSNVQISNPVYEEEHQTSIRGHNFVPKTPELTHGAAAGRTQSTSSYETPTKGFRDYTVIDHAKSLQQVVLPDIEATVPPPYTSDRSRSPTLPDTSTEHSYYHEPSASITGIEFVPNPKHRQYTTGETSLGATTQVLLQNNPLRSPTVNPPDQWKDVSHSSMTNTELRSTTSSIDVDVPKLNAPLMPLGSISSRKEVERTYSQSRHDDSYNSSSVVNNLADSNQSTYSSPRENNSNRRESFTSLKPTKSNTDKYPTLTAIIEHHIRQNPLVPYNEHSNTPTNSKHHIRFDTSTTTNGYDPLSSPRRHDGYIRPLTPPKSPIQPDVSTIHIDLNDLRGRSSFHDTVESPIIYRSSAIIYTRDKHQYTNGGELRTWSVQENDNLRKPSTSIQIFPSRVTNEFHYNIGGNNNLYENDRPHYYSDLVNTSSLTRSSIIDDERDQFNRSYKVTSQIQESLPTKYSSQGEQRQYTLKRTNAYDGLGIYLSADPDTRLDHRIRDLEPNSPGARIGLKINDRITHVNGINVENTEFGDVLVLIKQGLIDNNLQLTVVSE